MEYTKTRKSIREVPLSPSICSELKTWREQLQQEQFKFAGSGIDSKNNRLVFPSSVGTFMDDSHLRRDMNGIQKRAGVSKISVHGLRHTYASAMIAAGTDVATVSRLLGHSSIRETLETYTHMFEKVRRKAALSLEEMYATPTPQNPLQDRNSG